MANHGIAPNVRIDVICLHIDIGYTLTLDNVHHVLDLRVNLLSCQLFDNKCYYNGFGDGKWKLTKGSIVVGRDILSYTRYKT